MSLSTECAAALLSFRYASLNIKERYKNLRFCHGFLASLSADHNALLCGRASFTADHNALRCEEPRFQRTRMHCALPQFETKTTTTTEKVYKHNIT